MMIFGKKINNSFSENQKSRPLVKSVISILFDG